MTGAAPVGHDARTVAAANLCTSLSPAVVFVNPKAGSGRAASAVPQIRAAFAARSIPAEFIFTSGVDELELQTRQAIAAGARSLFAVGGDGTFQGLVNAAFGAEVILGVLPAGGGNDFASALQIPEDPEEAAKLLLQGRVVCVDLARAHTADGRERLYLGGGGVGIDVEAAQQAAGAFRRLPGRSRYVAAALRVLFGFKPLSLCMQFPKDDLPAIEIKALLGAVLNTPTYGAGIHLAPEAQTDDGRLDAVLVEDIGVLRVLALLPRLARTGEVRTTRVRRAQARAIRISTDRPCLFHGDGEILGETPVEIEVVPQAINILAPAPR